jgi:ornithine cyclodeaminase/alanine dehydrogenase-like protein (mu-crystallin family)
MLVLSSRDLESLLPLPRIVDEVEAALLSYERREAMVPQRLHFDHASKTILYMPAFAGDVYGAKLVSVVPRNRHSDLPVTNGLMVLNDGETGMPLALLDAAKLTALRTGALGAIAIRYLSPERETSIGLIGCGVQGLHQAIFACTVRKISTVYYLHRSDTSARALIEMVRHHCPGVTVKSCLSVSQLLDSTNLVIAATTSSEPVLPDDDAQLQKKHFIGIGSYKPTMQEFPDAVYRLADQLIIDSEFARHETGDILNPLRKGILRDEDVFTIGKVMTGERKIDVRETTVFKSTGMALFDLFVARAMYDQALKDHRGTSVAI